MVHFEAAGVAYCLPVEATHGVRRATGIVALPAPGSDIAGVLPGEPPLTVLAALGTSGDHVLVVESNGKTFGLLVDAVTGLRKVDQGDIRTAPHGQERPLVSGTIGHAEQLVLLADPDAMADRL